MKYRVLITALLPLWLVACSDTPSTSEISKAIERHIVWQPWQVEGMTVTAESKVGSGYQYQFVTDLSPKADLYATLFTLGEKSVVRKQRSAAEEKPVKGVADAKDGGHGWDITVSFESDPFAGEGDPWQEGDVLLNSADYRALLDRSAQEAEQLEGELRRLTERVAQLKQSHVDLGQQVLKAREDNSLRLQKWESDFETRKDAVEERLHAQIQDAQNSINDKQKQQLIDLNAKFEKKFTQAETAYQDKRKAIDKALIDNDRDYNRAVRDTHDSYKTDVGNINTDELSAEEYRSYTDARRAARDKALTKLQEEHQAKRDQLRAEKDTALSSYEESMGLLQQEKSATLEEARRALGDQKETAIRAYQQELEKAMGLLEAEFSAIREELLKEEKALVARQHDVARELEQANADLATKQGRMESLLGGLAMAREQNDGALTSDGAAVN